MENKILVVIFRESNKSINKRFIDVPVNKSMKDYIDEVWGKLLQASDGDDIKQIIVVTFGEVISYSKSESIQLQAWPTYYPSLNDMKGGTNIVKQIINKMEDWGVDDGGQIMSITDDVLDFQLDKTVEHILSEDDINDIIKLYKNKYVPLDIEEGDKIYNEIQNVVCYMVCKAKNITNDELIKNYSDYEDIVETAMLDVLNKIYEIQEQNVYLPKQLQMSLKTFVTCWLTLWKNQEVAEKFAPSLIVNFPFAKDIEEYNADVFNWFESVCKQSKIIHADLNEDSMNRNILEYADMNKNDVYNLMLSFRTAYENILNYFLGQYTDSELLDNQIDLNIILLTDYPFEEPFNEIGKEKESLIQYWFDYILMETIS